MTPPPRHNHSITQRYVRRVMKMIGRLKKPRGEAELTASMSQGQELALSINCEGRSGGTKREGLVVPEPTL